MIASAPITSAARFYTERSLGVSADLSLWGRELPATWGFWVSSAGLILMQSLDRHYTIPLVGSADLSRPRERGRRNDVTSLLGPSRLAYRSRCGAIRSMNSRGVITLVCFQNFGK